MERTSSKKRNSHSEPRRTEWSMRQTPMFIRSVRRPCRSPNQTTKAINQKDEPQEPHSTQRYFQFSDATRTYRNIWTYSQLRQRRQNGKRQHQYLYTNNIQQISLSVHMSPTLAPSVLKVVMKLRQIV